MQCFADSCSSSLSLLGIDHHHYNSPLCFVCLRNDDDNDNDDDYSNDDNDDDDDDDDGNINGDVNGDDVDDDDGDDDNDGRWVQPSIRSQSHSTFLISLNEGLPLLHFAFCFQQITCLPALTMMN